MYLVHIRSYSRYELRSTLFDPHNLALLSARNIFYTQTVCLFVCLLGNLFSSGFNPSCVFALYSIEGS